MFFRIWYTLKRIFLAIAQFCVICNRCTSKDSVLLHVIKNMVNMIIIYSMLILVCPTFHFIKIIFAFHPSLCKLVHTCDKNVVLIQCSNINKIKEILHPLKGRCLFLREVACHIICTNYPSYFTLKTHFSYLGNILFFFPKMILLKLTLRFPFL